MPTWLKTLLRLTPVVAGASVASVVGLVAARNMVPQGALTAANNEVGNYLQTVGGIYAVLLAFVVFAVWNQFNEARGYVDKEAAALVDLHRTASGLPASSRHAIQDGLRNYLDAVLVDEWGAMARRDEATIARVGERLDHVWVAIHGCQPATECQHTVYSEVLSRFNDLTDLRTSRLTAAATRIPLAMRILLYTGALILVGSMYLINIEAFWLHATVTAALAGAVAHVLYLIVDLDEAFGGAGQVDRSPYVRAQKSFERSAHIADAAASAS